jgi:4-amino-4-deoxy-L-arabinose transferase-like glycosyltransferase
MKERHKILLFAGSLLLFLYGTWQLPLLGPDEPRYAQVAREMLETGDYFVPKLGGNVWFEKPVLLYWLIAFFYSIFGVNEFAARLPSVLAGSASVWFVYFTIGKIAGPTKAVISAAVLATTAYFIGFSHAATFDMLLAFCVTGSLCSFLLHEKFRDGRWWIWIYVFAGLGVLAKGFVALIIIALTLVGYLLITKQWRHIPALKPIQGIFITVAVIAIWFVPVSLISGYRFWDEFVYQHHFVRYTSSYYHRSQPFFFYLPILLAGTYPWSFAAFVAKPDGPTGVIRFAICWLFLSFLFFSMSKTKLPGYILPIVPAFAILAGFSLSNLQNTKRLIALGVILQLVLIGALFWGAQQYGVQLQSLIWMMIFIGTFTVIAIVFVMWNQWTAAWISYILILPAGMILFTHLIFQQLPWSDSKDLSMLWVHANPGKTKLAPYNVYDFGPVFYTNGRMELDERGYPKILTNASELHRYLMQTGEAHVYTGNDDLTWMQNADFWRVQDVIKGKERSIVVLHPK